MWSENISGSVTGALLQEAADSMLQIMISAFFIGAKLPKSALQGL
jgi:hypothetical protein